MLDGIVHLERLFKINYFSIIVHTFQMFNNFLLKRIFYWNHGNNIVEFIECPSEFLCLPHLRSFCNLKIPYLSKILQVTNKLRNVYFSFCIGNVLTVQCRNWSGNILDKNCNSSIFDTFLVSPSAFSSTELFFNNFA